MKDFGHESIRGNGFFIDSWGVGPYVLITSKGHFVFEDSDRFGPALVDRKTGDPINEMIPPKSPFWKAYERWRKEGRKTTEGKPLGTRREPLPVQYCVYSDLRRDAEIDLE